MTSFELPDTAARRAGSPRDDVLLKAVQQFIHTSHIPGMALAVANPDGPLAAVSVGYADIATRRVASVTDQYPWFSMTKIATATAAMQLHAAGHLDADAPIGTYLPTYSPHRVHGQPTTRQLLTHTAGLKNPLPVRWVRPEDQPPDPNQHQRILSAYATPRRPVGGEARYSNIGYLLAGEVIEAVTGRSVQDQVTETVLRPLGMSATGYRFDPDRPRSVGHVRMPRALRPGLRRLLPQGLVGPHTHGYTAMRPFLVNGPAYGGLIGSVTDAAKLAAAHAAAPMGAPRNLPEVDIDQMRTITAQGRRFDHGIGWFRKPADSDRSPAFVEHYGTGGGYWNAMRIYPGQGIGIVAMANTTTAWDVDKLFTQIGDLSWH